MLLDFISIIGGTKSLLRVPIQEEQNDLSSIVRHSVGNLEWTLLNVLKQLGL